MEALRVSIGLEAYAQRDPLVQYKNKASELFKGLFEDMRTGVVTQMYTYRPRNLSSVRSDISPSAIAKPPEHKPTHQLKTSDTEKSSAGEDRKKHTKKPTGKKRRRRRRRR